MSMCCFLKYMCHHASVRLKIRLPFVAIVVAANSLEMGPLTLRTLNDQLEQLLRMRGLLDGVIRPSSKINMIGSYWKLY